MAQSTAITAFEEAFAQWLGLPVAFAFWKGRVGCTPSCGLELGEGDEVILPGYTCVMNVNPIKYLGARPVYVDIEPARSTSIRTSSNRRSRRGHGPSSPSTPTGFRATWTASWRSPGAATCRCWRTAACRWDPRTGAGGAGRSERPPTSLFSGTSRSQRASAAWRQRPMRRWRPGFAPLSRGQCRPPCRQGRGPAGPGVPGVPAGGLSADRGGGDGDCSGG